MAWCGEVWHGVVWCGMVWRGVVWCGMAWCVVWHGVECGVAWYGMVRCSMVWRGMAWYGVVVAGGSLYVECMSVCAPVCGPMQSVCVCVDSESSII